MSYFPNPLRKTTLPTVSINVTNDKGATYQDFNIFKFTGEIQVVGVTMENTALTSAPYGPQNGFASAPSLSATEFFNQMGLKSGSDFMPLTQSQSTLSTLFPAYTTLGPGPGNPGYLNKLCKGHVLDGLTMGPIATVGTVQYQMTEVQSPSGNLIGRIARILPGVPLTSYGILNLSSSNAGFKNGDIITGATSKAVAIIIQNPENLEYDPTQTQTWLINNVYGTFTTGETITGSNNGATGTVGTYTFVSIASPELGAIAGPTFDKSSGRVIKAASADTYYTARFVYNTSETLSTFAQQYTVNFNTPSGTFVVGEKVTSSPSNGRGIISSVASGVITVNFIGGSIPWFQTGDTITGFSSAATGVVTTVTEYKPAFTGDYTPTVYWYNVTSGSVLAP